MKIYRTLMWFHDGNETLTKLIEDYFGLSTLLNRLLNENYDGKKIKFINIEFSTEETYELYPNIPKDEPYYFGRNLKYYGLFEREKFDRLNLEEKKLYLWEKAYKYLTKSSYHMGNKELTEAAEKAYNQGIEINLNTDYKVVKSSLNILGKNLDASILILFKEDGMYSKFTLEENGNIVFEREIDKTEKGIEYFLDIYKSIKMDDNNIIIGGRKEIEYLPLKIPLKEIKLK